MAFWIVSTKPNSGLLTSPSPPKVFCGRWRTIIEPTTRSAEQLFTQLIEQGHIRPIDVPLMVRAFAGTVLGTLVSALLDDTELQERWHALADGLAAMLLDGLLMPMPDPPGWIRFYADLVHYSS